MKVFIAVLAFTALIHRSIFCYPQITKKTFAPAMLPPVNDDPESRFESFTKTVERVSSWLDSTGQ